MFYSELRYFAENFRHVRYFLRKWLCRMCSVVLAHHPALWIHLHDKQCAHLCSFAHPAALRVCYIPTFPLCVLSFSNKKILSLSPWYCEMKFKSLLSFMFRRKLSFLASSVLLGQGVPPGNPVSPGTVTWSAAPGLSSFLPGSPRGSGWVLAGPELLLPSPALPVDGGGDTELLPAGGSSGKPSEHWSCSGRARGPAWLERSCFFL